jgi:hypothetical protein
MKPTPVLATLIKDFKKLNILLIIDLSNIDNIRTPMIIIHIKLKSLKSKISNIKDNQCVKPLNKYKEEDYKILLVKKDADAISTAIAVSNIDVSSLIMQYNDFKIAENVNEKQKILFALAKYLEPKRAELKEKNSKLEQNLFMAFNKLHIRHNYLEGKDREEYTANLKNKELLDWYDRTYNLSLIAIRLLELNEMVKPFEEIRKQYFDTKKDS